MSKNKKEDKKNPIEQAIGPRVEEKKVPPITEGEMVGLEDLQMQTMERLQDPVEDHIPPTTPAQAPMTVETMNTPVAKPVVRNVTLNYSPESPPPEEPYPPQKRDQSVTKTSPPESPPSRDVKLVFSEDTQEQGINDPHITPTDSVSIAPYSTNEKGDGGSYNGDVAIKVDSLISEQEAKDDLAEEKQLVALKVHIASQGFNVATVGAHLNILCSQPMVIPSVTSWKMSHWERLPKMVYKILVEPGFLDAIWPALKIVLGTNVGNVIWTTGIATTFAFFSVIQTLPFILEMEKAKDE